MAAFAALTSLKHIIDNLQNHPSAPISIDKRQVRFLIEVVTFLQEFLQGYNSDFANSEEADPLETRIADSAYAAEDVIESKIVDRIYNQPKIPRGVTKDDLYQDLQKVIEEMDLIKKAAMTIGTDSIAVRPQPQRNVSENFGSSSSSFSTGKTNTMVGFDDVFIEVLECLTGSKPDLQIIPIMGMGGIGKTTLAKNIFETAYIKEKFDIRAWTTISQDYNALNVLKELSQTREDSRDLSEDELGLKLYQYLRGRRYLIVMDDIWSIEVWDKIKCYFPNCKDGSRVIVTTRLSNFASHLNNGFNMKFLDEVSSWNLFSKVTFGEQSFPLELEEIGKRILRKCRGLPLSIVTIGGLLAKSEQTQECWEYIEENLNSIVNSEDHEYCFRILKMSYNHLPVYLKPCFLYMGAFEEDNQIRVSTLIKLWISEGFLVPTIEKTLETIAREYLKDLIDRNLVLVHELGSSGNIKSCKIHDLLKDLCVREAEKEKFYHVVKGHIPNGINRFRRVFIRRNTSEEIVRDALQYMPHARSVICNNVNLLKKNLVLLNIRLLRTLAYDRVTYSHSKYDTEYVFQLVNLRCLIVGASWSSKFSSLGLLWNLHTLVINSPERFTVPIEIWKMPHLRHVKFLLRVCLPDPPTENTVIMKNLQTMKIVQDLNISHELVKRIPNIKRLALAYGEFNLNENYYYLDNLQLLHKLESLRCSTSIFGVRDFFHKLTFPKSLRKLALQFNANFELEETLGKIGSLSFLQKFELTGGFFKTGEWKTVENQFRKLEFLKLRMCGGLEQWTLESSHFPLLKEIHLFLLSELKEIPSEIGDIPTLREIVLECCGESIMMSAKRIVEEQEELQGEEELAFRVRVLGY